VIRSSPHAVREPRPGLPRSLEVVLSAAGLLVTLPLLVVAAAAIRLTSSGPALFRQERVGRLGRPFLLLKLRTMRGANGPQVTASGDPRVTAVGRLLRRMKLDELPQLWNVVKGDMALVGPRPEVPTYVDLSDPDWRRVLEVRPGITDPVSLRLRFEEELLASAPGDRAEFYQRVMVPFKLCKYLEYQSVRTPSKDLEVLLQTVLSGLFRNLVPPYRVEDLTDQPGGPIQP
jgi:lipopolysaccharide/colanic/teichoic acid biosynthesis glycosyltransferase